MSPPKLNGDACCGACCTGTLMSKSSSPEEELLELEEGAPNGSSSKFIDILEKV
jgi:hypothetical protein